MMKMEYTPRIPQVYYEAMQRLKRKIDGSRDVLPAPVIREEDEGDVGIIFYGSMENSIVEIDDLLEEGGCLSAPAESGLFHITQKLSSS